MATKKIPLTEATATQLAEFAENTLGLEGINYRQGADSIRSKIAVAAYDKDYIEVEIAEADVKRIDPPQPVGERRMATISIQTQDTPGGSDPVPVAVNGKQMFITRNKDVTIPWEYYHALDNARKLVYEIDDIGRLKPDPREAHEYPFSLIHEDPPLVKQAA